MVAFGRLAVTGRLFLAVLTIYLVYVAISLLLPWEGPPHTQKHLQEDIAAVVKKVEGCEGEACLNVKVEREENEDDVEIVVRNGVEYRIKRMEEKPIAEFDNTQLKLMDNCKQLSAAVSEEQGEIDGEEL